MFRLADLTYKAARRLVVAVVGGTVLLLGVAMVVLPGPATVVIPLGLAILGAEFAWARRFLGTIRERGSQAFNGLGSLWRARRGKQPVGSGDADAAEAAPEGEVPQPAAETQDPDSRTIGS